MRKFLQYALNRVVITALLVLIQIAFFLVVLLQWGNYYVWFSLVLRFITFWARLSPDHRSDSPTTDARPQKISYLSGPTPAWRRKNTYNRQGPQEDCGGGRQGGVYGRN